jgi:hypothetical protein
MRFAINSTNSLKWTNGRLGCRSSIEEAVHGGLPGCLGIFYQHAGLLQTNRVVDSDTSFVVFLPEQCELGRHAPCKGEDAESAT